MERNRKEASMAGPFLGRICGRRKDGRTVDCDVGGARDTASPPHVWAMRIRIWVSIRSDDQLRNIYSM